MPLPGSFEMIIGRQIIIAVASLLQLLIFIPTSSAMLMYFEPENRTVPLGKEYSVNLYATGFDQLAPSDHAVPPVGKFFVIVLFDQNVLQYSSYKLGNDLGDIELGEALDTSSGLLDVPTSHNPNARIDLGTESLLTRAQLEVLQPDSGDPLHLARLTFLALQPGLVSIHTTSVDFFDADGQGFATSVNEAVAWARIITIPEPATFAMVGLGLAGLGFARRRK